MSIQVIGRGACEYLPELRLLISFWPMREFADDEWDEYVAQLRRYTHAAPDLRVLSWNPQNATPRPEQQQRLSKTLGRSTQKVALVTHEEPNGFASAVLAFVNPNIRTFSEGQWHEAWAHLGLTPTELLKVQGALQALREHVQ